MKTILTILVSLVLSACAAHEELPVTTPAPHGYSHAAKPKSDPWEASRAQAGAALDADAALEKARSAPGVAPSATVAIANPPPLDAMPDRFAEHKKECSASFSSRMDHALQELRSFDESKASIAAKCAVLEPRCIMTGDRHVLGCKGVSADDASFVETVCAILPAIVAIDESEKCVDVDEPVLTVRYGDTPAKVKQEWLAVLKAKAVRLESMR